MYPEKLLRNSLKYEVQNPDSIETICKTLHTMGIIEDPEPYLANSAAMCFEESDPPADQIITVLNALDYGLDQPNA